MHPAPASIAPSTGLGLWGYAEADPAIVGVLVVVIAALAVGYVGRRILQQRAHDAGSRAEQARSTARSGSRKRAASRRAGQASPKG